MGQVLLPLVVALTVAAVVFGVTVLVSGRDPGLVPAEPDGRAVPLPGARPLRESDVGEVRFDTALRGYRMTQVDQALRRAAYDIGYKSELIGVLEAEVAALRAGRTADADALRQAREQAERTGPEPSPPARGTVQVAAGGADAPTGGAVDRGPDIVVHRSTDDATGPAGDATGPAGDATGPAGDATGPAGDATGPAGGDGVADRPGAATRPAGDASGPGPVAWSEPK
ncbi:DivIVA domain-containing protein [Micromonospora sp. KLBMP9576]|uniref:DivIVA domain-containing protein n=1 Tax=Micromonospora sp. KLBMP9576 TaxID=3424769 RepID=UPI003D93A4CB